MSAKVTEAHMEAASKLWDAAWRNIAREEPAPVCVLALALADAEQAERERCIKLVAPHLNSAAAISVLAAIRARGTPAKEKADG